MINILLVSPSHFLPMKSRSSIWIGMLILLLLNLAGCGLMRQTAPTPGGSSALPTLEVSADQIALAMQNDEFFSDYRGDSLIIHGVVSSISQQGNDWVVELKTNIATRVFCNLGNLSVTAQAGDAITVVSDYPNRDVSRQGPDLLIKNCTVPGKQ
jgi:hypothetical protein